MSQKIVLSGIKPSGSPHLGNYAGMLQPALALARRTDCQAYYFIADYHALNSVQDPARLKRLLHEVAATYLALGLDPARAVFYRQSAVPEIFEISQALACVCPKGFMNRAHAYKAAVAQNLEKGLRDPDAGVNMGLFNYPLLMAADILAFDTDLVPVGRDQKQHVEYARDLAIRFNKTFGDTFRVPEISLRADLPALPGTDGRKMSKSYDNTIALFDPPQVLKHRIMKLKTDSKGEGAAKDPSDSLLVTYFQQVASPSESKIFIEDFIAGMGYGTAKHRLFEKMEALLSEPRRIYTDLMADPSTIDRTLAEGATKARQKAGQVRDRMRRSVGIS